MRAAPLVGYQSKKAAQAAAFFADREGASIEKMKLIKLLYLSEREFVSRYELPMLFDEYYSLKDGPICSSTLNGINGELDEDVWKHFLIKHDNRNVSAARAFEPDDFDELSVAEVEVLESVWTAFGHMTAPQIRNYTHKHCPEYTEVTSGRDPIWLYDIMTALGIEDASDKAKHVRDLRRATNLISY